MNKTYDNAPNWIFTIEMESPDRYVLCIQQINAPVDPEGLAPAYEYGVASADTEAELIEIAADAADLYSNLSMAELEDFEFGSRFVARSMMIYDEPANWA